MSTPLPAPVPESTPSDRSLFRVNPMSYLVIGILVLAILVPVAAQPLALGWLLLLPLAFAWWVYRTRTVVDEQGVTLSSWRSRRTVPWDEVKGVLFPKRGFGRLVTTDDAEHPMGGVSFHDLPRLSEASRGRIRDPFAAEASAPARSGSGADVSAPRPAGDAPRPE